MQEATIVIGLGFGDEGKGSIVDFLCREEMTAPVVVRFNGGSQAAHNVITPDGRHHTFAQFGSGSFVPNTRTHLAQFSLVDLFALDREARALQSLGVNNPYQTLSMDRRAKIITPFQKAANRLREALRNNRHGSCGMGIGETMADSLAPEPLVVYASDLSDCDALTATLGKIQKRKFEEFKDQLSELSHESQEALRDEITMLHDPGAPRLFAEALHTLSQSLKIAGPEYLKALAEHHPLVFEGAQGVLLDEWYGFHPHTTWSTTSAANALEILKEIDFQGSVERLGLLRAYHTRHGAGPFPSYSPDMSRIIPDRHNGVGPWQGEFRVGPFDLVLARYALEVCEVDSLVLTNLDRLAGHKKSIVSAYQTKTGVVNRLSVKSELEDLDFQETMTELLFQVTPILEDADIDDEDYVRLLSKRLEKPISILSLGPTARDKQRLTPHLSEVPTSAVALF